MAKKNNTNRPRKIGKQTIEKKPLLTPKQKNAIWTTVILIALLIFFIVNNTRKEPEQGPYPPNYQPTNMGTNK